VVLVFVHIPKAAGTTLGEVVRSRYARRERFFVDREDMDGTRARLARLTPAQRGRLRYVEGIHLPFGIHARLCLEATYITMLRHPVDRIISHYRYVKREPAHYLHDRVVRGRMSLEAYAASDLSSELDNGQVRLLCGSPDHDSVSGHAPVSASTLAAALRNLERFEGVGITERFDESLLLFSRKLAWSEPCYESRNEATEPAPPIPETARHSIAERNSLDMALYEHALHAFDAALRECAIDASTVERFRERNREMQATLRRSPAGFVRRLVRAWG
jgi:hypothetical protein